MPGIGLENVIAFADRSRTSDRERFDSIRRSKSLN